MAEDDYEVGYGKPPKHGQFQPGTSGNPAGRRKPRPSLSQQLDQILAERVSVSVGDKKSRRITKEEFFLRKFVNRALAGDEKASRSLLEYLQRRQSDPNAEGDSQADEFLIAELQRMLAPGESLL
jgi:hypothetical protein